MLKLYYANIALLEENIVFEEWFDKMNAKRKEKILRCKVEKDKKRSLMAGILLKHALESEGLCYETLEFSREENGKPYVCNHPEIHFSLTHSGEYAGCLIGDAKVGLDIERRHRESLAKEDGNHLIRLAKKTLSLEELEHFLSCEEVKREKLFLEYWTKKESYSKAVGQGIQMGFSEIDTEQDTKNFCTFWTEDDYCISIYSKRINDEELKITKLSSLS